MGAGHSYSIIEYSDSLLCFFLGSNEGDVDCTQSQLELVAKQQEEVHSNYSMLSSQFLSAMDQFKQLLTQREEVSGTMWFVMTLCFQHKATQRFHKSYKLTVNHDS